MLATVEAMPVVAPAVSAPASIVVAAAPPLVPVLADDIAAPVFDEDFDALADTLCSAPIEARSSSRDWMQAMLRLAAADMKRVLSTVVETADAETSLAA